ncbi:phytoene desaturase family protein [Alkalicoccobacillus porphyridii]|uniref:Phytoene desaturase n=1 Tax=Alkalicoccobacillus porphyridii TaxID=2597270 RepID=A0A553ZYS7_9BACI|nr:phytoene desaturase family protein [Alkalicoccobacillus porphyridii]TSB46592.1 phytoene desaturase [Alkalicoccobacillus porphyridii]
MSTVIVGGGIGGLVTALYLSNQGEEVTIVEKNESLGGRLAIVERDGYRIDKGPTIVLLPDMIQSIFSEAGFSTHDLEFIRIDPLYSLTYSDGTVFTKWSDKDKQIAEISRVFPGEEDAYIRYLQTMNQRFTLGKSVFLDRHFLKKRDFFSPGSLAALIKLKAYQTVEQQTQSFFKDSKLREAFSLQTLYIGGSPAASPALYSLVSYSEHQHGIWYLKGGYGSLIPILEEELKKRGVKIVFGTNVTQVLHTGNRIKAVQAEKQLFTADRFILNSEIPIAQKMLPAKKKQRTNYTASSGCLLLYMGLDKVYTEADVHQFYMSKDFQRNMREIFVDRTLPVDPSIYVFHPSIIDKSLAPEGKGVLYVLIPVPSNSDVKWESIQEFVDECVDVISKWRFPDLHDHIEWMDICTPEDAEKEGLYQGGSFGLAPTLIQSGVFRPQFKPFGYENLYAVGASIHPGGGIPIVMQGAKLLSDYLLEEAEQVERKVTSN